MCPACSPPRDRSLPGMARAVKRHAASWTTTSASSVG